ncbi:Fungalysin metallopeptidase-domain-containing protein [Cladochytrium replicatum]|nr:Fungalysin metallopeptidase-domain-containing protein [Cladochytrium replicatum]
MRVAAALALLAFLAASASAHPVRRSEVAPRAQITIPAFFQNEPVFEAATGTLPAGGAIAYVAGKTALSGASSAAVTSSYKDSLTGVTHVHAVQTISGIAVANTAANVNIKDGKVLSYGHSFVKLPAKIPSTTPKLSAADAVVALAKALATTVDSSALKFSGGAVSGAGFAIGDIKASVKWYALPSGGIELAWGLETELVDSWLDAYVSAVSGQLLGVADHTSHTNVPGEGTATIPALRTAYDADPEYVDTLRKMRARSSFGYEVTSPSVKLDRRQDNTTYSYYVVPLGSANPLDGLQTVVNPADLASSPLGWHDVGTGPAPISVGNNVKVVSNTAGLTSSTTNYARMPILSRSDFSFEYPIDLTQDPKSYTNASATGLFYSVNVIHDITYKYGFDEVSGNFQTNNFGKGGAGNDAVFAISQDYSNTNNADFSTPADGSFGRMRMYPWTRTTPNRDGSLEHPIVFHEFCHGVSNRLTGGNANANCLSTTESRGMGEGWSDVCGYTPLIKPTWDRTFDVAVGTWNLNSPNGVRAYKYSTSTTTNPLQYENYSASAGVHAIGTIWATILYEVLWNFLDAYPYSPLAEAGEGGNAKFFRLVITGMKLQPCAPTFITARDAIVQADVNIYGGVNKCLLWKGFAKRGLGFSATTTKTNFYDLPADC